MVGDCRSEAIATGKVGMNWRGFVLFFGSGGYILLCLKSHASCFDLLTNPCSKPWMLVSRDPAPAVDTVSVVLYLLVA